MTLKFNIATWTNDLNIFYSLLTRDIVIECLFWGFIENNRRNVSSINGYHDSTKPNRFIYFSPYSTDEQSPSIDLGGKKTYAHKNYLSTGEIPLNLRMCQMGSVCATTEANSAFYRSHAIFHSEIPFRNGRARKIVKSMAILNIWNFI